MELWVCFIVCLCVYKNVCEGVFIEKVMCAQTRVMSREAAAALICKEGCFTVDEQSNDLANVPTDLCVHVCVNNILEMFIV